MLVAKRDRLVDRHPHRVDVGRPNQHIERHAEREYAESATDERQARVSVRGARKDLWHRSAPRASGARSVPVSPESVSPTFGDARRPNPWIRVQSFTRAATAGEGDHGSSATGEGATPESTAWGLADAQSSVEATRISQDRTRALTWET